jgi:hypothetical protein
LCALAQQDLARACGIAKTGGENDDVADRAVVVAGLEADRSKRRIAGADPGPEPKVVSTLSPIDREARESFAYRCRGANGRKLVVLDYG